MNYFRLLKTDVPTGPILEELASVAWAWDVDTRRQRRIAVQRHTSSIFLRQAIRRADLNSNENHESAPTALARHFPAAIAFMNGFAEEMQCSLSRALFARLSPRSSVSNHTDGGSYYFIRDRYHLVLSSDNGSLLFAGDERVAMKPGELWWFDNKQHHESHNDSDAPRIHLIFDLLPARYLELARNPTAWFAARECAAELAPLPAAAAQPARALLRTRIMQGAILRADQQRLVSPQGIANTWQIDMRRMFMDPVSLGAAADLFCDSCMDLLPFQIAGMEAAAIPLVAAILLKMAARGIHVNGFIIRKERKTHGTGGQIDGIVTDAPIVVIDDTMNSGSSLERARIVLEQFGGRIASAFVVVDFRSRKGDLWRKRHDIPVRSVFDLADLDLAPSRTYELVAPTAFRSEWSFASPDPNFFHRIPKSFPVTDGARVYFGSDCGILWCLNTRDASVLWAFRTRSRGHKGIWSSPALCGGRLYFGSYDGNVYCLDSSTGRELWRFIGADWVGSSPAVAPDLGLLFVGLEFATEGRRGSIVALDMETGEKRWEHFTRRYTHASPAYCQERRLVACGSNDDELFLLDAVGGSVKWRFSTSSVNCATGSIRHAAAFDKKRWHVITGCANGQIYVIDIATGDRVWSVQTGNTVYTIPLIVGDTAFVGSTDKYMYVLDLENRRVRGRIHAGAKIFCPPTLARGHVYFGACNGRIYELDPETCQVTGTHQVPDAVTNAIAYNEETAQFYALTYVNELFAFSPDAGIVAA